MHEDSNTEDGKNTLGVIVRSSGFVLLVIGLLVCLLTISEALKLYHEPDRIKRFALAIEQGSNIDKSLSSLRENAVTESRKDNEAESLAPAAGQPGQEPAPEQDNVSVSYFLAWIIDLLLLLLIARLGLGAVKTGGELVLYDMQIKKFARMVIKEAGKR